MPYQSSIVATSLNTHTNVHTMPSSDALHYTLTKCNSNFIIKFLAIAIENIFDWILGNLILSSTRVNYFGMLSNMIYVIYCFNNWYVIKYSLYCTYLYSFFKRFNYSQLEMQISNFIYRYAAIESNFRMQLTKCLTLLQDAPCHLELPSCAAANLLHEAHVT